MELKFQYTFPKFFVDFKDEREFSFLLDKMRVIPKGGFSEAERSVIGLNKLIFRTLFSILYGKSAMINSSLFSSLLINLDHACDLTLSKLFLSVFVSFLLVFEMTFFRLSSSELQVKLTCPLRICFE